MKEKKVQKQEWYRLTPDQIAYLFKTDLHDGYTEIQLEEKRKLYSENDIYPAADNTQRSTGANIVLSVLSVLLMIMLTVDFFVTKDTQAIFGIILILLNYLLVLISFYFARGVIVDTEEYSVPEICVRRGGKTLKISQKSIIPGDIVLLSEGDIVPCDLRLFAAEKLKVLEKNITGGTGEKDAEFISYDFGLEPSKQQNMLFAGSVVFRGEAAAIACDTGADTLLIRRGGYAVKPKEDKLSALKMLRRISGISSVLLVIYSFAIPALTLLSGSAESVFPAFIAALSFAGASMCELLTALGYIAIGCGVYLQSKNFMDYNTDAILKNISAIEKLSALTCLCVPKIGGICEDRLEIELAYTQNREYSFDSENADRIIRMCRIAIASFGTETAMKEKRISVNDEKTAILTACKNIGADMDITASNLTLIEYRPGHGESPVECALVLYKEQLYICVRGSAKHIVKRCTRYFKNGNYYPLTEDGRTDLIKTASEYEKNSSRVIAIASKESVYNNLSVGGYCESELCFEGYIVMREPFSENCVQTVKQLNHMGIKTLMFCDDMSEQSVYLAQKLGVCGADDSEVISSPEVTLNNSGVVNLKMNTYRLFRGLNLVQKKYVIRSFEKNGENIGIIGQNIYDISLMDSENTVGFAANVTLQGKKRKNGAEAGTVKYQGSQALKRAAGCVILTADSDGQGGINSARDVVIGAKVIMNNIYKILLYMFASNIGKAILTALAVYIPVLNLSYSQIIFAGAIVDLCAVLSIALSKNKIQADRKSTLYQKALKKPWRGVFKAFLYGVSIALLTISAPVIAYISGCKDNSNISFISLCCAEFLISYFIIRGRTRPGYKAGHSGVLILSILSVIEYIALSALFPGFFAKYMTGSFTGEYSWCALLPCAVILIVDAVIGLIKKYKR